jgi:hypothetical protein
LSEYENPSTSVHLLIDEINKVKMGQTWVQFTQKKHSNRQ